MRKNDINLFKAAGGERAKSTKRSGFFYIVVFAIIISVIAIGVAVFFNMKVMNAENELNEKKAALGSYQVTKADKTVRAKAKEYQDIVANEEAARANDRYNESESKLYPHATQTEVSIVKQAILDQNSDYSVNDPVEGERFTPWDYKQLRADLVAEDAQTDIESISLFYYALQVLETAQRKNPETNIWNGYYRGYMVIVFTGGTPGYGISEIATNFAQGTFVNDVLSSMGAEGENLNVDSPFMSLTVEDYSTIKYGYIISRDVTYNVLLCPLKSVIERMFDILEKHSNALLEAGEYSEAQKEYVSYFVQNVEYAVPGIEEAGSTDRMEPTLTFNLVLPMESEAPGYLDGFSGSPFFSVSKDTKNHAEQWVDASGTYYVYEVKLHFIGEY